MLLTVISFALVSRW